MGKKVLIHALGATIGGGLRHLTNFLPELARQDTSNHYVVLVRSSIGDAQSTGPIEVEHVSDVRASGFVARGREDLFELPMRLAREHFDLVVSLTNLGTIWSPIPHILFQRNSLYFCESYLSRIAGREKVETALRRFWVVEAMKRADVVVTPSAAMANMIRRSCPQVRHRRFHTIYHGFDLEAGVSANLEDDSTDKLVRPTLFYPAHLREYKGFRVLLEAIAIVRNVIPEVNVILTISHKDNPKLFREYLSIIQEMEVTENFEFIGAIDAREVDRYYRLVDALIFPSSCESFGFPLVEAMGHRLPIIASDIEINHEICERAAEYFDPVDAADCARAISRVLLNPEVRSALCRNSAARASEFDWSWSRYVHEFRDLVEQVAR